MDQAKPAREELFKVKSSQESTTVIQLGVLGLMPSKLKIQSKCIEIDGIYKENLQLGLMTVNPAACDRSKSSWVIKMETVVTGDVCVGTALICPLFEQKFIKFCYISFIYFTCYCFQKLCQRQPCDIYLFSKQYFISLKYFYMFRANRKLSSKENYAYFQNFSLHIKNILTQHL